MSNSRSQSQQPTFSRKRSNTAQSILRPPPATHVVPFNFNQSKTLNAWVHDTKESSAVIFNHSWCPGILEGDLLRVKGGGNSDDPNFSFLFTVPRDDGCAKPALQISIPKPVADAFRLRNNSEVTVTKVDRNLCLADYIEFFFQDQYLGRNDMWRLGEFLVNQCVYTNQEITFGSIVAKIKNIYIDGKQVSSACVTPATKAIYRSLSAKVTMFIQVCRELWEFAGDGERAYEKIVHSFLPSLFEKWRSEGTNHIVTIVLISRVFYEDSEVDYAAGPLRQDCSGNWYKDFYKVITDLEVVNSWKPTLVQLKTSFWDFQRDILLTHHYHQTNRDAPAIGPPGQVRLVGRLSFAHDGPILEALNLALGPAETHYIDRSLSLTGASMMVITPGTGFFNVSKDLLRLTTTRLLDQGIMLNLVSLAKPPLHQTPVFAFRSGEPKQDQEVKFGYHPADPLWGQVAENVSPEDRKTFWWEPFWVSITFWDKQTDLPFRRDRFIGRAKMHQIQMLGLLELDVLSSIEVPFLPEPADGVKEDVEDRPPSKDESEQFDVDIFALKPESKQFYSSREPTTSVNDSISSLTSLRISTEIKRASHRNSVVARIPPIEESPRHIIVELPKEDPPSQEKNTVTFKGLSRSPSQSSIRSLRSTLSAASQRSSSKTPVTPQAPRTSLASKYAPSWLLNPFRSVPTEPKTTATTVSASPSSPIPPIAPGKPSEPAVEKLMAESPSTSSPIRMPSVSKPAAAQISRSPLPMPMSIQKQTITNASNFPSRSYEADGTLAARSSYIRQSPVGTPPSQMATSFGKRRSTTSVHTVAFSSSPSTACNPTQPTSSVSHIQSSLARRWQHQYPQVLHKHDTKWNALTIPACLPLTVEYFPTTSQLESQYDVFSYDFVLDPNEMRSFLVTPPPKMRNLDDQRRAWALAVMRGMVAVRLAQGFQFIVQKSSGEGTEVVKAPSRRGKSLMIDDDVVAKPVGAADVLRASHEKSLVRTTSDPIYLSMTNEIHRISYMGEIIQVRRYVRRMPASKPFKYQFLVWPKLGGGYTEMSTTFQTHGLENYGWNRLDMLVAGYEQVFNESLRYWRTRFIVIPSDDPPDERSSPSGEPLSDEEIRILGLDWLADQFTKLRWQPADEKTTHPLPPVRFLQTTLGPAASIRDPVLMDQLDQIHAAGPLRKRVKSERDISDMSLAAIAKAMREEDGVPIKNNHWHHSRYPNSFTGYDFVSWLVREFRDVSSRTQATELGVKLMERGLMEHVRGYHTFLDGHYFYRLKGEYSIEMTPKGWFRRYTTDDPVPRSSYYPSSVPRPKANTRAAKKRIILSQSMIIDIDPHRKSNQAESVVLHHDVIHNPGTVFHFELQWIGTTARSIDDLIRNMSKNLERFGLTLAEAYVGQISDIRSRNAYQSCFPIRLAVPPPIVMDLDRRVEEGTQTKHYFEQALLKRLGYVLDIEAANLYPSYVDTVYTYRHAPYTHTQYVHRSGMGFVQIVGGAQGFLFLTNRLMGPGRMFRHGREQQPAAVAEGIRLDLERFCKDKKKLSDFWDEELEKVLKREVSEEPPPLTI